MTVKKQFIVLGLGSFGASVAVALQQLGCDVVAVDHDMEQVNKVADKVTYAMQADIGNPDLLYSLGTRNFDGLIVAVSESMEGSVMATLMAKEVGIPYVLCKARDRRHADILRKIGADAIVFPEEEMGKRIAKNLLSANLADWIELSPDYSVIEIATPAKWVGKSLRELDVRKNHEMNVVGIKDGDHIDITPDPDIPLNADMILMIVGANTALEKIEGRG